MIFVISHDVFDSQTTIAIDVTDDEIVDWVKENTTLEVDAELREAIKLPGMARCVACWPFSLIRFSCWGGSNKDIGILAHEAFHLAEMVYDRIGVAHHIDISGEVFAYHIQHTVEQVLKGIAYNTPKIKKRRTRK